MKGLCKTQQLLPPFAGPSKMGATSCSGLPKHEGAAGDSDTHTASHSRV
jgi:hypothetical protein